MFFGYMNPNWEEEFDIPIGPDNNIEPGGPDQGQPTHFYPRRNPLLFTIRVPKDFGDRELVWTLTTHGRTQRAFASLKSDYRIDKQVMSMEVGGDFGSQNDALRDNIPPVLEVRATGPPRRRRSAARARRFRQGSGQPAGPPRRTGRPARGAPPGNPSDALYRPPSVIVPTSGPGLRLSWIVYRGPAHHVTFDPGADEDVDRDAAVRELALVAAVPDSRAACRQQVESPGHVPRTWPYTAARGRQRWVAVHLRRRHGHRHEIAFAREVVQCRRHTRSC